MKNLLKMLAMVFLMALVSCEKDQIPVSPTEEFTGGITQTYDTVELGQSVQFQITTNADSVTSDIPEAKRLLHPINTTFESGPITKKTVYHVSFFLNGKIADVANPTIYIREKKIPTLNIYSDKNSIEKGSVVLINWSSNGNVTCAELPEVSGISGQARVTPLQTMTYHFTATLNNVSKGDSLTVTVTDPPIPTIVDYLPYLPWKELTNRWRKLDGTGEWNDVDISAECLQDNLFIFYSNQSVVYDQGLNLCPGETVRYFPSTWTLNGNFISGFGDRTITSIDWINMTWTYETIYITAEGNVPVLCEETFGHPN